MDKTININYKSVDNGKERAEAIAEILSDGVYSYLKAEGLLTDNDRQAGRIHAVLDQVRKVCVSNEEEKNENNSNYIDPLFSFFNGACFKNFWS